MFTRTFRKSRAKSGARSVQVITVGVAVLALSAGSPVVAATKKSATTRRPTTTKTTTTVATTAAPKVVTTLPQPARGGTLVAAISADPGQLNPAITTSGAVHSASELMYNVLVEIDDSG